MLFIIAIYTLRHYLCVHSRGHQTIDHLEERGEEEEVLDNFLWQEEKGLLPVSHTLELFWKATLRKVLRDGVEHIWAFPSPQLLSCTKPIGKTVHLLFECVPWPQETCWRSRVLCDRLRERGPSTSSTSSCQAHLHSSAVSSSFFYPPQSVVHFILLSSPLPHPTPLYWPRQHLIQVGIIVGVLLLMNFLYTVVYM